MGRTGAVFLKQMISPCLFSFGLLFLKPSKRIRILNAFYKLTLLRGTAGNAVSPYLGTGRSIAQDLNKALSRLASHRGVCNAL